MIYFSTGGCSAQPAWKTSQDWINSGITNIELSGGAYDPDTLSRLKSLKLLADFKLHNYFPPPEKPFVFNLASLDHEILKLSMDHARRAIRWSAELGSTSYSFHAGFLMDPPVNELGKKIKGQKLFNRNDAMKIFIENVNTLSEDANNAGVQLLIENNVCNVDNHNRFQDNPFLMLDMTECKQVMCNTPDNVKLLIDVAHLNVSAKTLGFDRKKFLKVCNSWIDGYHLSDNCGSKDSNEKVTNDSWFWPYLKPELDYYSLEIYNISTNEMQEQLSISQKNI